VRGAPVPKNFPHADSRWLKLTQADLLGVRLAHETYGAKAIYVTENGCGYDVDRS